MCLEGRDEVEIVPQETKRRRWTSESLQQKNEELNLTQG